MLQTCADFFRNLSKNVKNVKQLVVALLVLLLLLASAANFDMDLVVRNKHIVCVF